MTRVTSKPQGRPVSTGRGHNGRKVAVRLSETEWDTLQRLARAAGCTVADWLRRRGLADG